MPPSQSVDYERLLAPLHRGRLRLRNRVQVTSHGTYNVDDRGAPDQREAAYWAERARGGAGLLVTGTNLVHPSSPFNLGQYKNFDDSALPGLALVADGVHEHGAVILAQIGHMSQRAYRTQECWGPSAVSYQGRVNGIVPHAMTTAEIREVVAAYAAAAERCVRAGMDGVEIAVGHGQLVNAFLSPLTNQRSDAYGGSARARFRFCAEVVDAVRQRIGGRPVVGFRVNATDQAPGGLGEQDWVEIARWLEDTGAGDYVNVSVDFSGSLIPTVYHPHGLYLAWAGRLRRALTVPVFGTGRVNDPLLAEAALRRGDVDVIGMTRAHLADPHLVGKLAAGRPQDIRPCIGCLQMCVGELWRARNVKCVYNFATGRETTRPQRQPRAGVPAHVVVVGGGPAGLESARVHAEAGHRVTLLERGTALGGRFAAYAALAGRAEFRLATGWLARQVRELGVDLRLGQAADAQAIAALAPDRVVLALGADTTTPPGPAHMEGLIDGLESIPGPDERGLPPLPLRVLVVDDFYGRGLVTAAELAGRGHEVGLVCDADTPAPGMEFNMREDMLAAFHRQPGARVERRAALTALGREPCGLHAVLTDAHQQRSERCVDHVLASAWHPSAAAADLAAQLALLLPAATVDTVGDAREPGRLEHAIESANLAARAPAPA